MDAMTSLDAPRPRPRAFWSDLRFLLGIALIAASIAGVWLVVAAARHTEPVLAATRTIVAGESVASSDLRVVDVALGPASDAYARPATLAPGAIATRTISRGELVPTGALGSAGQAQTTTVVLSSAVDVPAVVERGSVVDVWAADRVERGEPVTPRILVAAVTVASVDRRSSALGSPGTSVEVVIPQADVAAVLAAVTGEASVSVVPTTGPTTGPTP